ncbi:hypothetical protein AZKH_3623 [Azoarcus sp. KH32C]|nr:hypothetical protein AZKH_3623 [Azoarcus sp. KH32C]
MTLVFASAAAQAQTETESDSVTETPAMSRALTIVPSLETSLKYTDNGNVASNKNGAWIAEVAPAISVVRESGGLRGHLNARLRNVVHLDGSGSDDSFLALQGFGEAEAIEKRLFVDVDASINRNNRSLLQGRSGGDELNTSSASETRVYGISPRWLLNFGPDTRGQVLYSSHWMSGGGGFRSRRESKWNAALSNPRQFGALGWGLQYDRSETENSQAGQGSAPRESGRATLFATLTPQFRMRAIGGYEKTEFTPGKPEDHSIVGGGFDWHPTERTTLSATTENRFFGRSYDVSFSHRRALSTWNLSYVRDITSSFETQGASVFSDPDFKALYDALAPFFPDPVQREAVVRSLLGFPPVGSRDFFVTDVHYLTRKLIATASFIGVRNILTVSLSRNERTRLEPATGLDTRDEFSRFSTLTSRLASVALSHRLSAESSLNASITRMRSEGVGTASVQTERTMFNVGLSKQLGPKTTGDFTYRFQRATGAADFTENMIMATLSMRF